MAVDDLDAADHREKKEHDRVQEHQHGRGCWGAHCADRIDPNSVSLSAVNRPRVRCVGVVGP